MGKGFEKREWGRGFYEAALHKTESLHGNSNVCQKAPHTVRQDRLRPQTSYPYAMICEGRLKSSVAMEVVHKGQEMTVTLAAAGDGWRDSGSMLEVIPEKRTP